jgi:hypothetical protein
VINSIFGSVSGRQTTPMLRNSLQKVGGYADIQRAIQLACKDVDARLSFLSHRRGIAAKWTLKQVQGDGVGNG